MSAVKTFTAKQGLRELSNLLVVAIITSLLVMFPPLEDRAEATLASGLGAEASFFDFGTYYAVALNSKGLLYTWGYNANGELGDGDKGTDTSSPQLISVTGVKFSAVAAGGNHTLALATNGSIYAWGKTQYGQVGNNSFSLVGLDTPTHINVAGVSFSAVAAGGDHSVALSTNGSIYVWGENSSGQLGDNSTTRKSVPTLISVAGVSFSAVSAGSDFTIALSTNGSLYAWGENSAGDLFSTSTADILVPTLISVPGVSFSAVSAGSSHTLALATNGSIYAWGRNTSGGVGNNSVLQVRTPTLISVAGVSFSTVAAGGAHSMALATDGSIYTWGKNFDGQLGHGNNDDLLIPTSVSSVISFSAIAAGGANSMALGADGSSYTWGSNARGQLGNGLSGIGQRLSVPTESLFKYWANTFNDNVCDLGDPAVHTTAETAFEISTSAQLWEVTDCVSTSSTIFFELAGDIDLAEASSNTNLDTSSPIGFNGSNPLAPISFSGVLHGNDKTIKNIAMSIDGSGVGLFAVLESATISNLVISGSFEGTYLVKRTPKKIQPVRWQSMPVGSSTCIQLATKPTSREEITSVGSLAGQMVQSTSLTLITPEQFLAVTGSAASLGMYQYGPSFSSSQNSGTVSATGRLRGWIGRGFFRHNLLFFQLWNGVWKWR